MVWRAPLELLGMGSEKQVLRIPLFLGYRELRDAPFATFRATLQVCPRPPHPTLPGFVSGLVDHFLHGAVRFQR